MPVEDIAFHAGTIALSQGDVAAIIERLLKGNAQFFFGGVFKRAALQFGQTPTSSRSFEAICTSSGAVDLRGCAKSRSACSFL